MTGETYAIIGFVFFLLSFGSFAFSYGIDGCTDWNVVGGAFVMCAFFAFFWPLATVLGLVVFSFLCSQMGD